MGLRVLVLVAWYKKQPMELNHGLQGCVISRQNVYLCHNVNPHLDPSVLLPKYLTTPGGAAETSFRGSLGRQRRFSGIGAPDEGCRVFERDPGMPEKSPDPPEGTDVHGGEW